MSTFWSLAPVLATAMLFVVCIILWFVHRQRKNFKAWTEGAANWRSTAHAWGLAVQARAAGEAPALPAGPALPSEPPAFPAPSAGASGQVPLALIITALTGLVTAGGKIYLDSQTKQLSVRTAEVDSLRKQLQEWKSAEVELFHYELTDWSRLRQHAAEAPGPGRRIDGGLLDGGCGGVRHTDGRNYPAVYGGTEAAVINCDSGKVTLILQNPAAILLRPGRVNHTP